MTIKQWCEDLINEAGSTYDEIDALIEENNQLLTEVEKKLSKIEDVKKYNSRNHQNYNNQIINWDQRSVMLGMSIGCEYKLGGNFPKNSTANQDKSKESQIIGATIHNPDKLKITVILDKETELDNIKVEEGFI